jgi:hypothetical protein
MPPKKHEDMMLYITATSTVISTTIVVEREEEGHVYKVQRPRLLHQWGTVRFQNPIPACTKTTLCPPDHLPQTTSLLWKPQDYCDNRLSTRIHPAQQRHNRAHI